jgi:hypothetical protein
MGKMLAKLNMTFDGQRSVFEGNWKPNKRLFKKGDYLAALLKAARLERMVVILRVRDFLHRTGVNTSKMVSPALGDRPGVALTAGRGYVLRLDLDASAS